MEKLPHILVIFGSSRQGRRGEVVVNWLMERLDIRTDATFELVDLRDLAIPFFDSPTSPSRGVIIPGTEAWSAQVKQADGFIFITPEYNHGYPAILKNALDVLYREWVHKPAAIVSYGGLAAGYRAAEQLRQVFIELKMVPVRDQVGISLVPGAIPGIDNEPGSTGAFLLDRSYNMMLTELLWWAAALTPARTMTS
ncbi:MAG TPA: NAD(P)H-dependent oxidoreductase [Ktedonobacteraceae bacterium]|nr:NAD(P)H-dependent oxidoreductase [Ktedonobacteraceae bacterium]